MNDDYAVSMFVYPLIVDRKMRAIPALKLSIKAARANSRGIIWLMIVTTFLQLVAMMACVFPALLFVPLQYGAYYLVYENVFPHPSEFLVSQSENNAPPLFEEPTTLREKDYLD